MAKSVIIASGYGALASGTMLNALGAGNTTGTEANNQASATEACTFSQLSFRVAGGGSGTNTVTFRTNGANGSQTASVAGTGLAEDLTNTDVLAATDLFNTIYTDTGTNTDPSWLKYTLEFTSGYGAFQGMASYAGVVADVASATRFFGLSGNLGNDGAVTESFVAFVARGYTTFEALQVRVTANARVNDSIFRNRINSANGTGVITFGAGVTGLLTATGLADAIADGVTINTSLTLDTGVQDLTVTLICATLKSTDSEQDVWTASQGGLARAASATAHYFPPGGFCGNLTTYTEPNARVKPGFAGTAKNLRAYLRDNTYTADASLKLFQNGSAVITTILTAGGGAGWYENTTDSISFDDNDELSFEVLGGSTGSATLGMIGMTFAQAAAVAGQPASKRFGGIPGMAFNQGVW